MNEGCRWEAELHIQYPTIRLRRMAGGVHWRHVPVNINVHRKINEGPKPQRKSPVLWRSATTPSRRVGFLLRFRGSVVFLSSAVLYDELDGRFELLDGKRVEMV